MLGLGGKKMALKNSAASADFFPMKLSGKRTLQNNFCPSSGLPKSESLIFK